MPLVLPWCPALRRGRRHRFTSRVPCGAEHVWDGSIPAERCGEEDEAENQSEGIELPPKFRLPRVMYNRSHHEREDEMKIPKQAYTAEFKELAVTRVKDGMTAGATAKEL
jgi:hypothetical protein